LPFKEGHREEISTFSLRCWAAIICSRFRSLKVLLALTTSPLLPIASFGGFSVSTWLLCWGGLNVEKKEILMAFRRTSTTPFKLGFIPDPEAEVEINTTVEEEMSSGEFEHMMSQVYATLPTLQSISPLPKSQTQSGPSLCCSLRSTVNLTSIQCAHRSAGIESTAEFAVGAKRLWRPKLLDAAGSSSCAGNQGVPSMADAFAPAVVSSPSPQALAKRPY
jgi:hypothetical protein